MWQLSMVRCGLCLLVAMVSSREAELQESLIAGVDRFHSAYRAWDIEGLKLAAQTFERACAENPDSHLAHHWLGVSRFHILVHQQGKTSPPEIKKQDFKSLVREARKPLEKAVELDRSDSEAHALLGTLAGMQINRDPTQAFWLGRSVLRHRRQATHYGADNPRTQYLIGAAFVQGPRFLGGVEKGLPHLRQAERLFEVPVSSDGEEAMPPSRWGHVHCLILIGEIYQELKNLDKAEEYFRKATALNPENELAQRCLKSLRSKVHTNE